MLNCSRGRLQNLIFATLSHQTRLQHSAIFEAYSNRRSDKPQKSKNFTRSLQYPLPINTMGVPNTSQVKYGASVSIVLKADQRTGREVQGKVQDVLTRGNHPRGIKVRLTDGRIGRVQRMAAASPFQHQSDNQSLPSSAIPVATGEGLLSSSSQALGGSALEVRTNVGYNVTPQKSRYTDVRLDEHLSAPPPSEEMDLMAFAKPAKQKKARNKQTKRAETEQSTETASLVCPVCRDFEGDEAAVQHHVESHFAGS